MTQNVGFHFIFVFFALSRYQKSQYLRPAVLIFGPLACCCNCGNCARFSADPQGFLIATDVAARGLDIPNIEHVVHYQVRARSNNPNLCFNLAHSVFV
jgi:hypothetical protein